MKFSGEWPIGRLAFPAWRARHAVPLRRQRRLQRDGAAEFAASCGAASSAPTRQSCAAGSHSVGGFSGWLTRARDSKKWIVEDGRAFGLGEDAAGNHQANQTDDGGPFRAAERAGCWRRHAHHFWEAGGFAGDFAQPFG
jgi:hypothetical protein